MKSFAISLAGLATFFIAQAAGAHMPPAVQKGITSKGPTLTNAEGMTLYTFDKDAGGHSVCKDACAVNWPPLAADTDTLAHGDWSRVVREDGASQWAYHGKPLYTWAKDAKPGDITGDGLLGNSWHVAQP